MLKFTWLFLALYKHLESNFLLRMLRLTGLLSGLFLTSFVQTNSISPECHLRQTHTEAAGEFVGVHVPLCFFLCVCVFREEI